MALLKAPRTPGESPRPSNTTLCGAPLTARNTTVSLGLTVIVEGSKRNSCLLGSATSRTTCVAWAKPRAERPAESTNTAAQDLTHAFIESHSLFQPDTDANLCAPAGQ